MKPTFPFRCTPAAAWRIAGVAVAAACVACSATAPTAPAGDDTLKPNANLVAQNIPPIPMSLVRKVQRYTELRGHGFAAWHPTQREMLVSFRPAGADTPQLFRLRSPMGSMEQLTEFNDPVTQASYEPLTGRYIVFERAAGGNEVSQLYRLDPDTKEITLLTDLGERNEAQAWLHRSARMLVTSVPLDRTAQGGTRTVVNTNLWLLDPLDPTNRRKLAELPGTGWFGSGVSWDDQQIALTRYISANESQVWLVDLTDGKLRQLLPGPGSERKATYMATQFAPDNKSLYIITDRAGEFRELVRQPLGEGQYTRVTPDIAWDITGADITPDGRYLIAQANVNGRTELRLFDGITLAEVQVPNMPAGSVTEAAFHPARREAAFVVNSAHGPSQIYSLDPRNGRVDEWTQPVVPAGIDTRRFADQQVVRWTSFDGRIITGLLNPPPAKFSGKRPVLVLIHGGPEAQAEVGFLGRYNYLVNELGVAVIQPNVRGSSGLGKTFQTLDDGMKREDAVKDIGALLDWIGTQPNLDAGRVLIAGGSYGGYMALACAVHYDDRIAGAIDIVGISDFVTFLTHTESYRRDLRRVEYGDERDPAMRAFLSRISPLGSADRIRKPLFVVQGKNDPRVPVTEAEQIVAKVRANDTPVWYLRAENEGHGFVHKENADFLFYAGLMFMQDTLLKKP